ncbi:unnamed protein product [Pleuronectes platessa]|uniref:Uncharacterized protein n=1 Tax=Pleuronectes platessa TaxID=8262 RepID=A0A9N7YQ60_PLEPL|nr:unnamed protein product [Pleuronectes platessa]
MTTALPLSHSIDISYQPSAPHSFNDLHLANQLNEFYYHFERQLDRTDTIPHNNQPPSKSITNTSSAGVRDSPHLPTTVPHSPFTKVSPLSILDRDVKLFRRQNIHKAAGPDCLPIQDETL